MGDEMKEQREMQTQIDELNAHIQHQQTLITQVNSHALNQAKRIVELEQDAARYRWLNKYTSQLFMVTEQQMNEEVDRAMAGGVK
jgi:hypothetical protein